jgi:hypothetical protein
MISALAMADSSAASEFEATILGLAGLPMELKLRILELVVAGDKKLALELACKSSVCC